MIVYIEKRALCHHCFNILALNPQKSPLYASSATTSAGPHVESTRVVLGEDTPGYSGHGEIISTQTVSSKTRTVETITVSYPKQCDIEQALVSIRR